MDITASIDQFQRDTVDDDERDLLTDIYSNQLGLSTAATRQSQRRQVATMLTMGINRIVVTDSRIAQSRDVPQS